jgi:predicted GH43/DUF377 family glycosyl hydrolase
MQLKRFEGNPILSPHKDHPWENEVTTNPGAWYDSTTRQVFLLYRAAGDEVKHKIYFGLATSRDGYHFERASDQPVFSPSSDGFDAGCVEDPRIVKFGEWYYVTYASRPFPPGMYWLPTGQRQYNPPACPPDFPWILRTNQTSTGLALTKDFHAWIRAGRMTNPLTDDRDVILFPEKVSGKYVLMHRPMTWVGPQYGTEYPAMWISTSDDMLSWSNSKMLAKAEFEWENQKIGGNTPPIKTEYGWLTIYHAVGKEGFYRLGAMLLDLEEPSCIRYRTRDWILQPEQPYELQGYYPGVCFPCGKVVIDGILYVYYGGADKYVGLATCPLAELVEYMLSCPV